MNKLVYVVYGENVGKFRNEILNWDGWFSKELGHFLMYDLKGSDFLALAKQLGVFIRPLTTEEKEIYVKSTSKTKKKNG